MIKNLNKKTALQETPDTNNYWKNLSSEDRINLIRNKVDEKGFKFTRADERGFVFITLSGNLDSGARGEFMLSLEMRIKNIVDESLTLWHEPIGDKNSLRKLRGIKLTNE